MSDFKYIKNGNWGEYLLIDSDQLEEAIHYIKNNDVKNIELNFYQGYRLKDISFLAPLRDKIEGLNVISGDVDLRGIEEFTNLKNLNISDELSCSIDFSKFKYLERCSILWHKNLKNISACHKLKELLIKKMSVESPLEIFNGLENIETLTLNQSRSKKLDFLKCFPKLKELEIYYSPALERIDGLEYCRESLNKVVFDHCKNVVDYKVISLLNNLEYLGINDAVQIPTLSFIKSLKKIKHLSFVGTNVLDGDLSFCAAIDYVGHDNKKHYHSSLV